MRLGPLRPVDAPAVHEAVADPELRRWLPLPRAVPARGRRAVVHDWPARVAEIGYYTDDGRVDLQIFSRVPGDPD